MLSLEGCIGAIFWEDTSPVSAEAQSMANFLSEPKVLPLRVCMGRASQPRFDSRLCAEISSPCLGVSVELGGMRTRFGLCCTTATVPADAGVGDCVEAVYLSFAGGVTEMYAGAPVEVFCESCVCLSLRCSFKSSSFFFYASVGCGCRACGGGDFGGGFDGYELVNPKRKVLM